MAIYIDERTMEELAKVADDVEFSDSESDDAEEEDYDPFGDIPQRKNQRKPRNTTEKRVNIKQCVRLSTVDNFQVFQFLCLFYSISKLG